MSVSSFWAAVVLATVVRAAALPLPGTEDTDVWKVWSFATSTDVLGAYGLGGTPPEHRMLHFGEAYTTVDYPPVAIYEMAAVGRLYRALLPDYPNDWRLSAAVKLPGFAAGLLLTWLLYAMVQRISGDVAAARWAAVAYWANPATILNGEVLGYLDPLMALPGIAALVAVSVGQPALGGAAYAVALLTKPQALLLGPAMLVAAWRSGGWRRTWRTGAAGAATLAVLMAPFVWAGASSNLWNAFGSWQSRRDILSGNAANFWWIATWLERGYNMIPLFGVPGAFLEPVYRILAISSWMEMGLPNPRPIGTALVLGGVTWGCWRAWRSRALAVHAALAAFTGYVFFVFGVSVHEHHLITAVPCLVLAAALDRRFRPAAWTVSAMTALNLNLFYGISRGWGWAVPRRLTPIDLSVLLAIIATAGVFWFAHVLRTAAATAPSPAVTPDR